MPVLIRDFVQEDLVPLLNLWVTSWSEVYPAIDFPARRPWFTEHIAAWLGAGGMCRIAAEDPTGTPLGFIMIRDSDGLLDQICVANHCKGDGTARQLLDEARRLCPNGVMLSVNALNPRAIRFYEREGFVRTGAGVNPNSGLPILHYRSSPVRSSS